MDGIERIGMDRRANRCCKLRRCAVKRPPRKGEQGIAMWRALFGTPKRDERSTAVQSKPEATLKGHCIDCRYFLIHNCNDTVGICDFFRQSGQAALFGEGPEKRAGDECEHFAIGFRHGQ